MSAAAAALFQESAAGKAELLLEKALIAETLFVLTNFYKQARADVADALRDLITACRLKVANPEVALDALARFKAHRLDFPDALAAALAAAEKIPVASFDRDFDQFHDVSRSEPKA
jgi:predicted nucleic acid-binding protein